MLSSADLACAQRVLSEARGHAVRLREVDEFRAGRVVRCHVVDDGDTIIVKVAAREEDAFRDRATIHNEHAALQLLRDIGSDASASLLGADPRTGVLILEDLGDAPSLATVLLADDKVTASQAARNSAGALGALHVQTIGRDDAYYEFRERLSPCDRRADRFMLRGLDIRSCIRELPKLLAEHDLPVPTPYGHEVESIVDELAEPGDFLALSGGDPCPDNERITGDGVRFFDFEAATFRHALVDAAHYVIPFPNCWCWRLLPDDLSQAMLAAHRAQLTTTCTQASDDSRYDEALARTSAAWILWTLVRRLPRAADDQGAQTRIVVALANFSRLAGRSRQLPGLKDYCETLLTALQARWPDTTAEEYPAFGGPPWPRLR
jgi:hypothetical protein